MMFTQTHFHSFKVTFTFNSVSWNTVAGSIAGVENSIAYVNSCIKCDAQIGVQKINQVNWAWK